MLTHLCLADNNIGHEGAEGEGFIYFLLLFKFFFCPSSLFCLADNIGHHRAEGEGFIYFFLR